MGGLTKLGIGIMSMVGAERTNRHATELHNSANAFNAHQAKLARKHDKAMLLRRQNFNSAEAMKARRFEKRMSNTKIQRRMRDMRKAGLNPILASQYATSGSTGVGAASVSGGGS